MKEVHVVLPAGDLNRDPDTDNSCKSPAPPIKPSSVSTDSALGQDDDTLEEAEATREENTLEEADTTRDDDAFSPAEMEEFRRFASARAHNRTLKTATSYFESPRFPTSISIQVPTRVQSKTGRVITPHIFPALKERPLTHSATPRTRTDQYVLGYSGDINVESQNNGPSLSSSLDLKVQISDQPSSGSSSRLKVRMNSRALHASLLSARKTRVATRQKQGPAPGQLEVRPISGRPGIVSLHGRSVNDIHLPYQPTVKPLDTDHTDPSLSHRLQVCGSVVDSGKDRTFCRSASNALSSECQMNRQVTSQRSSSGVDTHRRIPTTGRNITSSRDRPKRSLSTHKPTSGRIDNFLSLTNASNHVLSISSPRTINDASGVSLLSRTKDLDLPHMTQSVCTIQKLDVSRVKTAPLTPRQHRFVAVKSPREESGNKHNVLERDISSSLNTRLVREKVGPSSRVSVILLQVPDSQKQRILSSPSPRPSPRSFVTPTGSKNLKYKSVVSPREFSKDGNCSCRTAGKWISLMPND